MSLKNGYQNLKNGYQDHRISNVEKHIEVLNHNSTKMRQDIAVIKEILKRHDKFQWLILGSIVGIAIKIIFGA